MNLVRRIERLLEFAEQPLLVEEISHALGVRTHAVRVALRDNPRRFSGPLSVPGRSSKAKGYLLAGRAWDGSLDTKEAA